jgi:hypothetical protein
MAAVVRPLFALRPRCPECGGTSSRDCGRSPAGSYAKRRCRACGCGFKSLPLAYRVTDSTGERIVPADEFRPASLEPVGAR